MSNKTPGKPGIFKEAIKIVLKYRDIIALCEIVILVSLLLYMGNVIEVQETELNVCWARENIGLYNRTSNLEGTKTQGVYFSKDDYYCVWAKNRDPVEVSKTEAHEYAHYLIDGADCLEDGKIISCEKHFCDGGLI